MRPADRMVAVGVGVEAGPDLVGGEWLGTFGRVGVEVFANRLPVGAGLHRVLEVAARREALGRLLDGVLAQRSPGIAPDAPVTALLDDLLLAPRPGPGEELTYAHGALLPGEAPPRALLFIAQALPAPGGERGDARPAEHVGKAVELLTADDCQEALALGHRDLRWSTDALTCPAGKFVTGKERTLCVHWRTTSNAAGLKPNRSIRQRQRPESRCR